LRGFVDSGRWDYPDRESFGPREERWRMYAIIEDGSHQFKVSEGDHVRVDRRDGKAGDEVVFPKVLLIAGTPAGPTIGTPQIDGAQVVAIVVDQFRTKKIIIQKFRRRKNVRRRRGHRQPYTTVRITSLVQAH
jgi:large subunit ribosomal protein L21